MNQEIWQIIISGLTPVLLVLLGFFLNRRLKGMEQFQWANQKAIEKRIDFYFKVVPILNDLFCFFTYVGTWKELKPPEAVNLKRKLDKDFYVNAPLLPGDVMTLYFAFIDACYAPFNAWGQDAKLKTGFELREAALEDAWDPDWNTCFAPDAITPPKDIQVAYKALIKELANSLGIDVQNNELPESQLHQDD